MKQTHLPGVSVLARALLTTYFLGDRVHADSSSDSSTTDVETKNFIDTVSGYAGLSTCAEKVLSTVVRAEFSGCEDTYALTSYTCFCTDSSSYMSAVISNDVISSCNASIASAQASSAIAVFDAYCEIGVSAGLVTETTQAAVATAASTSSATPAGIVTVTVTPTSGASSGSDSSSSGLSSTSVAILLGVLLTVFGVAMLGAVWFIRRKFKANKAARVWPDEVHRGDASGSGPPGMLPVGNFSEVAAHERPCEISAPSPPAEMLTAQSQAPVEVVGHPKFVELPAGVVAGRGEHLGLLGSQDLQINIRLKQEYHKGVFESNYLSTETLQEMLTTLKDTAHKPIHH